jgi:signal transduction histidine kinase
VTSAADKRTSLVTAVAHEVGNLLAAIRLAAYLLPHGGDPRERARGARQIEQLAAQAGEILGQLRALLGPRRGPRTSIAAGDLLESVRVALSEAPGIEHLELQPVPAGLPPLRGEPQALHLVLTALVRSALDGAGATVRLGALRRPRAVAFELVDPRGGVETPARGALPRGNALLERVAAEVLRREGGRIEVTGRRGSRRVLLVLPAVPAPARKGTGGTGPPGRRRRRAR